MSTAAATTNGTDNTLTIDIVSDNVCPWCFIGKRRLEQALKQLAPSVKVNREFSPFFLNPDAPKQSVDKLQYYYSKFGGQQRVDAMIDNMKKTGKELGINFSYKGRTGNTLQSHRLVTYAQKQGKEEDIINRLFSAYFEQGRDLTLDSTLIEVAKEAGLDGDKVAEYLKTDENTAEIKHKVDENYSKGITGVPAFIINNKYMISGAQTPDVFVNVFKRLGLPLQDATASKAQQADAPACSVDGQNC